MEGVEGEPPVGTDRGTLQNGLDLTGNSCVHLDPVYPFNNPAGCYANGQILAHGDRWREDDCTFCQCISGEPRCVATACGQSCMSPVKVPGECCPVCEGEPRRAGRASASVSLCCVLFPQARVCFLLLPAADNIYLWGGETLHTFAVRILGLLFYRRR